MALNAKLDFKDLEALANDLQALSKAENRKVLSAATRAGANVIRDEARKRAPRKTGKLKRNIVTMGRRSQHPNEAVSGVHIRGRNPKTGNSDNTMKASDPKNSFYWRFLEMGTSKMAARPFIRPAFEGRMSEMERAIETKLVEAIDKVLSK
ncbi:TPA: HK97 gp10 family phage protein [Klebsiella variicola subsp. variicola]|nr:HK97 gp10 family phage protein [Klebsiella variicola subsp. variicola]